MIFILVVFNGEISVITDNTFIESYKTEEDSCLQVKSAV